MPFSSEHFYRKWIQRLETWNDWWQIGNWELENEKVEYPPSRMKIAKRKGIPKKSKITKYEMLQEVARENVLLVFIS